MKKTLLFTVAATVLFFQNVSFGQAPEMGSTMNYVLFTSTGEVGNTGVSHVTGNIGTQIGTITLFGNVDGEVNSANASTAAAVADLAALYAELNLTPTTELHGATLGTGEVLDPGVYQIATAGTLAGTLTLDAGGDENALFIFKVGGAFSTATSSEVILMNNAKACNVFWVADGAIEMESGTRMKGTLIANNGAISMATGSNVEGRMFSTAGDVAINGSTARLPLGCELPTLSGPDAPDLESTECFALFTAAGALTNTGVTTVTGEVGTNAGAATGFDSGDVTGTLHVAPSASTATAATDLPIVHAYLNNLLIDIELLDPSTVGNKLVLTPHTYLLDAGTVVSDTLFLNAQENTNAVFVLIINGALSTGVGATVELMNGAQTENVFWVVNGDVSLNTDSKFVGTIVSDSGTVNMATGAELNGRALTTNGIFNTNENKITAPTTCSVASVGSLDATKEIAVYPNPFNTHFNIDLNNSTANENIQVSVYNVVSEEVLNKSLTTQFNMVETGGLPSGIYFYKIFDKNGILQTGRIIAQ